MVRWVLWTLVSIGAMAVSTRVVSAETKTDPAPAASSGEKLRPVQGTWMGGASLVGGVWHLRGTPDHPGKIISRDVVMTMNLLDWTDKTRTGVATGSPRIDDAQNTITAVKMTVEDPPARDQRRAIFQDQVRIVHRPEKGSEEADTGELGDVFTHDVVLTCDHAEYFYRLKTGFATGHILLTGARQEDGKLVKVTLTSDRLEYEDRGNIYRAIGNVVIHDGDSVATTNRMVATTTGGPGKRKLETVDFDGPWTVETMVKDDTESPGAEPGSAAASPTPAPAATAPAAPGAANPTPASPAPATPALPPPTSPVPAPPTSPVPPAKSP